MIAPLRPPPSARRRPRDPAARRREIKQAVTIIAVVYLLGGFLLLNLVFCVPAWLRWGLLVNGCPEGKPVPEASIEAYGLRRGQPGTVYVDVDAVYSRGGADDDYRTAARRFSTDLFLVDQQGEATKLEPERRWWQRSWHKSGPGYRYADVRLPDVPDGDYVLRAEVDTPLGEVSVDAELPLYAPALVHLATDRPLYKPGQTIKFRAAVLRMKDLAPIDGRPGSFTVTSPAGEILLEERVPAGVWGVAGGDFPLADDAPVGGYTVSWTSGQASDSVSVAVEPFSLPRYEVKLQPSQPWYRVGETPALRGTLRYRSGAPVADAQVDLRLLNPGGDAWPPPNSWLERREVSTDSDGAFELELEAVPEDLQGLVTIPVVARATDAAGERVGGGTALKLSQHGLVAQAETELRDGLVPDFNNRVYLRVTLPDGTPLPGAEVTVKRAWDPADEGVSGTADADAVAAVQLDPGKPVSVVIPPLPYRPPPPSEQRRVFRTSLRDLFGAGDPSLDERVIIDRWDQTLEPCATYVESGQSDLRLGIGVSADGAVRRVVHAGSQVERCLADRLRGQRAPRGTERFYAATWRVEAAPGATLRLSADGVPSVPGGLASALERARLRARPCISHKARHSTYPSRLHWTVSEGSRSVSTRLVRHPGAAGIWNSRELQCVQRSFGSLQLDDPADRGAEGVAELSVRPDPSQLPPDTSSGTVRTAYELEISASMDSEALGSTTLVLDPGAVPNLRLRPEDPMLAAGDQLSIKLLRGPDFYGSLPDEGSYIHLMHGHDSVAALDYDEDRRVISGTIPQGVHGLLTVEWSGARAVLLVPRVEELAVDVQAEKPVYRPGDTARLNLRTTAGERGTEAAVSLFGVDEALSQLAPLLSPDDWGRITVRATVDRDAFDRFDARALLSGRIAGENAVLATLQRIADIPTTSAEAEAVSVSGSEPFDPVVPLTENFYELLADARSRVAAWEEAAPEDEIMTPKRMLALWNEMLSDRRRQDLPVQDAYGRTLELHRLPYDLLQLTDPRLLVADSRRTPEDVENWHSYVMESAP